MLARVRRRHVAKGPGPGRIAQEPLPSLPELETENAGAKRQVYLVTFPHPRSAVGRDGAPLAQPGVLSHEDMLGKFLEACASPAQVNPHRPPGPVPVACVAVFREFHRANGVGDAHPHFHVAVKAEQQHTFRFAPVKKALQDMFGLAPHWSCTHAGYW